MVRTCNLPQKLVLGRKVLGLFHLKSSGGADWKISRTPAPTFYFFRQHPPHIFFFADAPPHKLFF